MSIRTQLFTGFFVLILIFVIGFFVNRRLSAKVSTNTIYLSNSEAVIRNSNVLHKQVIEMQSSFRGYLLTAQESFLQTYYQGIKTVPPLIEQQQRLISKGLQQERIDSIAHLHRQWIEYADSLISARKDTAQESLRRYRMLFDSKLRMEVGKKLNDQISRIFRRFDAHEYTLREQRRLALAHSVLITDRISVALTIISIAIAIVSSLVITRMILKRIRKMVGLAQTISEGSFITIQEGRHDELSQLVEALNRMSRTLDHNFTELSRKNKELDQFAYVVSHDLKAPLRGIANIISWIDEDHGDGIPTEIRRQHELIRGRTDRLERMINGLLEYARIGRIARGVKEVRTEELVREITELIVPKRFRVEIAPGLPVIRADKLMLERVFTNILSNAVKYNDKEEPWIRVSAVTTDKFHEFTFEDNGMGIEERYFEKIFEIFQTLQERDAFESTGVGLAIVRKILEDNNGWIRVRSKRGEGSAFTIGWPKAKNEK